MALTDTESAARKLLPRMGAFESLYYALGLNSDTCHVEMEAVSCQQLLALVLLHWHELGKSPVQESTVQETARTQWLVSRCYHHHVNLTIAVVTIASVVVIY